jgi:hypothetical protein
VVLNKAIEVTTGLCNGENIAYGEISSDLMEYLREEKQIKWRERSGDYSDRSSGPRINSKAVLDLRFTLTEYKYANVGYASHTR